MPLIGNRGENTGAPSGNSGSEPLRAMIFLSVSASSSEASPGIWGGSVSDGDGGGGGIIGSKLPGSGGKITPEFGCCGMTVCMLGAGVLRFGGGVWGGGGSVSEGDGRGRGEKNPGGGIPGGIAGKLMIEGSGGGRGGANLGMGERGTGAIENREFAGRGGIVWGRRWISAGVSSINPTEPGRFFDEFPP